MRFSPPKPYRSLSQVLDHITGHQFLGKTHREVLIVEDSPDAAFGPLRKHTEPDAATLFAAISF